MNVQSETPANKPTGASLAPVVAASIVLTLLDVDAIKKDQDSIKRSLTRLDMAIHANAVQCLMHAQKHGDTSLMRRLLVDIIDAKTGYRRQGLINWVRKFSPMELKGDTINLSGTLDDAGRASLIKQFPDVDQSKLVTGEKRPFLVHEANNTPFWTDADNNERVVKPVWRDNLLAKVNSAEKEFRAAWENTTKDGKAVDPTKPFFDGVHGDKVVSFFDEVAKLREALPKDATREVRQAQADLAKAEAQMAAVKTA